jgi:hypothetical protein
VGSQASSTPTDGCRDISRHPHIGAWPTRAREFVSFSGTWRPCFSLHPLPGRVLGGLRWALAIYDRERLSSGGAWSSRAAIGGAAPSPLNHPYLCYVFIYLSFIFFKKSYLGICLCLWEITVFEFVMVTLFTAVLFMDSNNVVTVPTILWWLLQVSSEDAVGLVLICFPFTFLKLSCAAL